MDYWNAVFEEGNCGRWLWLLSPSKRMNTHVLHLSVVEHQGTFYFQVGALQLVLGHQGSLNPLISVP